MINQPLFQFNLISLSSRSTRLLCSGNFLETKTHFQGSCVHVMVNRLTDLSEQQAITITKINWSTLR